MRIKKFQRYIVSALNDRTRALTIFAVLVFSSGVVLFLWFGVAYIFSVLSSASSRYFAPYVSKKESPKNIEVCAYRREADGVCVSRAEDAKPRLVAVMVENSLESWPLSGISSASIVYEAPVESDIPRFLAIYPINSGVDMVGPVRSSRPYYLDLIEEYGNPMYLHVGGSNDALQKIEDRKIFDINEMIKGWYFWRDDSRKAPHNAYTSAKLWQNADERYGSGYPLSGIDSWVFTEEKKCELNCADSIDVYFKKGGYSAKWKFNPIKSVYERYGEKDDIVDKDSDGSPVEADTVIVQRVESSVIDEIGRKDIEMLGKGDAIIFRDGIANVGFWRKDSREARTRWLDKNNKDIPLRAGHIWIEIVPQYGDARFNSAS